MEEMVEIGGRVCESCLHVLAREKCGTSWGL